jgi:hypothetical protein
MTVATPDQFVDKTAQALAEARADLSAADDARAELKSKAAGVELKLALRDLREGVRGMIRVSPLISVFVAAAFGAAWARSGRKRPVRR